MKNGLFFLKSFTLALLMLLSFNKDNATHFMGGDITYVCIGPNQYSVIAKLYQDCGSSATLPSTLNVNVTSSNCGYNGIVQLSNLRIIRFEMKQNIF